MTLSTRKPTGKPDWPILLIAGGEKTGKSWSCAVASSSPKIGRTLWLSIGETDPDAYGAIPGADFEIIEHDGSFKGILTALADAATEAAEHKNEYTTLLVVDSMTRLWDLITESLHGLSEKRTKPGREAIVTMDLWNKGKGWWAQAVRAITAFPGPALLTARLEAVTVMEGGKPTSLKADKIKTEKSLPYDVDGVIQMPVRGHVFIEGVRSVTLQLGERTEFPDFTVDKLWDAMGLEHLAPRTVSEPVVDDEQLI